MSENNVVPFDQASQLPANLQEKFGDDAADALIASSGGFPSLSIRGSKWRIKVAGDENPLIDGATGDPLPSLELVVIKPAAGVSKIYYDSKYVEGDDQPPTCSSMNGDFPDASSEKKQCESCAACPHNVWGSRVNESGVESKACGDSKVMAVSFATNLPNEELGGPMMLRVPAASLKDMTQFGRLLKGKGFLPQQVVMRVGFDLDASYPKLTFKAARPVTPEELQIVGELYDHENVMAITEPISQPAAPKQLAKQAPAAKAQTVDAEFDAEPAAGATVGVGVAATVAATPAAKKPAKQKPAKAKVAKAAVAATPVATETQSEPVAETVPASAAGDDDVSAAMDDILGELDNL